MKKYTLFFLLILVALGVRSQIRLPRLISNGMVLQRERPTKIWGWASSDEQISVKFGKKTYRTVASHEGEWMLKLPAFTSGGPYKMILTGKNVVIVDDILFGDVWVCSGQSNMELPMQRLVDKYPIEIASANNGNIRQFIVPDEYDFNVPRKDVSSGSWAKADSKNILNFSGAAYFFAVDIFKKNKIPIGLINAALGGAPAESWISEGAIKTFPEYFAEVRKFKDKSTIDSIENSDRIAANKWQEQLTQNDLGLKNNWRAASLDAKNWAIMNVPGYWADGSLGLLNGVVWFNKEITLTKAMVGKPAKLLLGRIVDADSVFVNGQFAGATGYQYPPRRYLLPASLLREGRNIITVKVTSNSGRGGFVADKPYELIIGDQTIDLKGSWKYSLGARMDVAPPQTFVRWKPVGLFNAMIAPLTSYGIKGVIWYQGESNTSKPLAYKDLMTTLIADWRKIWGQGDFPFLYVQLPNFMEAKNMPGPSDWAQLRQQQLELLAVRNTAMAVTIDLGEWNDIHPLNKEDVGKRLALLAQRMVYGNRALIASGPIFKELKLLNNKLVINFANIGAGLIAKYNESLKYFAIAGADKNFVWANAQIEGDQVVVWNDQVPNPVYVRYAWADNPVGANLYNKENLPASPFEAHVLR